MSWSKYVWTSKEISSLHNKAKPPPLLTCGTTKILLNCILRPILSIEVFSSFVSIKKIIWDLFCLLEQLVRLLSKGSQAPDNSSLSNLLHPVVLESSHHLKIFLILRCINVHTLPFTTLFIFWLKPKPTVWHHLNWGSLILWNNITGQLTPPSQLRGGQWYRLICATTQRHRGDRSCWDAMLDPHGCCWELIFLLATISNILPSLFNFKPAMSLLIFSVLTTLMKQSLTILQSNELSDCLENGGASLPGFLHHGA